MKLPEKYRKEILEAFTAYNSCKVADKKCSVVSTVAELSAILLDLLNNKDTLEE